MRNVINLEEVLRVKRRENEVKESEEKVTIFLDDAKKEILAKTIETEESMEEVHQITEEDLSSIESKGIINSEVNSKVNSEVNSKVNSEVNFILIDDSTAIEPVCVPVIGRTIPKKDIINLKGKKIINSILKSKRRGIVACVACLAIASSGFIFANAEIDTTNPSTQSSEVVSFSEEFNSNIAKEFGDENQVSGNLAKIPEKIDFQLETEMQGEFSNYIISIHINLKGKDISIKEVENGLDINYKLKDVDYEVTSIESDFNTDELKSIDENSAKKLAKEITKEKKIVKKKVLEELKAESGEEILRNSINKEIEKYIG
ncbi:hypothetical protein ACV3V0_15195 [Clostridium perfringens]